MFKKSGKTTTLGVMKPEDKVKKTNTKPVVENPKSKTKQQNK